MAGDDARRMLERMGSERREREAYEALEAERRMREPIMPQPGPLGPLHLEDEPTAHAPQSAFLQAGYPPPHPGYAQPQPGYPPPPPGYPPPQPPRHQVDYAHEPPIGYVAELAPLHLDDEDTQNLGLQQARKLVAEARRVDDDMPNAFEEPTRAMDFGTMDDAARGSPPGGRVPPRPPVAPAAAPRALHPSPPPSMRQAMSPPPAPPPRGAGMTRKPDEETRAVDLKRVVSLSEVDWDID